MTASTILFSKVSVQAVSIIFIRESVGTVTIHLGSL